MRYKIEYLANPSDEHSVCHATRNDDLTEAEVHAWEGMDGARRLFGAKGFQIRDLQHAGEVVSWVSFEKPSV